MLKSIVTSQLGPHNCDRTTSTTAISCHSILAFRKNANAQDWSEGTGAVGTSLLVSASHELGHSLGLAHSSVPGSVMSPFYTAARAGVKLTKAVTQTTDNFLTKRVNTHWWPSMLLCGPQDDLEAVQALYGEPVSPAPRTPVIRTKQSVVANNTSS